MCRTYRSRATTCLYPWTTGGHCRSALIVTLEEKVMGSGQDKKIYIGGLNLLPCEHIYCLNYGSRNPCVKMLLFFHWCASSDTHLTSDALIVTSIMYIKFGFWGQHSLHGSESCVSGPRWIKAKLTGEGRIEKLLPAMLCIRPSAAQHMSREQEREWD